VDGTSTLPNIDITGATAHLIGAVFAQATALNITAGANFTSEGVFDVGSFNIANTGTFNMAHGVTTATGFNNDGILAVADATTSTITGDYTQTVNGVLQIGASSAASYGKLIVTGNADLSASNKLAVNVAGVNTLAVGNTLPGVLTATGTLTAGPTYTVTDNSALFNFSGVTNGNAVDLTVQLGLTAAGSVAAGGNTAAAGAAAVFDTLLNGTATGTADMGTVITALGLLATQQAVSDAVGQTLPLMTGGMAQATFGNLHGVNRVVQARMEQNRGLSSGDSFVGNRKAWVKPLGSWADQKDRNGAFGYDSRTYGVALGADSELSQAYRIGAAFAYTHSNVDSNSGAQRAAVNSYQAVLYGSSSLDENTELNWQADYGYNQNKGNRYIAFVNRTALADYNSDSIHLGAGIGRTIPVSEQTSFTPSFRADYTSISDKGYTETGAGALNMIVNGKTTDELILAVDGKVVHSLMDNAKLTANLGLGYDVNAKQNSITASFAGGGAAFTTNGINPSATLVRGGLGYVANTAGGVEITARYDLEARTGYTGQTASVKARWAF
jgi:outer membrane autotransporter protein